MGDHFAIQVFNELVDDTMSLETSIHWHGVLQKETTWADGASWVSQCPIRQREAFQYRFNIGSQTGTYWYHSHYLTQYCDGLRGPLVIYDPEDPLRHLYDVDDESTVVTLSDWFHTPSPQLAKIFGPVFEDSTLINGLGRYAGGPSSPLTVIQVQQGLRYRLRLIAMSCSSKFNFTIDGHRMKIIEADGIEIDPVKVDSIPILVGQRYSVVVAANQPVGNYWIRALSDKPGGTFEGGQNMAILRYKGAPEQDPTSTPGPYLLSFDEGKLHPLIDPHAPGIPEIGKADVNIQFAVGTNPSNPTGFMTFNNVSFINPDVPVLLQILSGARHASELLPSGSIYELPLNKVIELSFPNPTAAPGGPHPIHLHGHAFSVVRVAGCSVPNFVNPVRRDVVSIGTDPADNVTIRFKTDNPGPWFLHCHIEWHLNFGLAVVMAEATSKIPQENIPVEWSQLCQ
ncbi:laccase [Chiua virens]|nr:laccase [Chiua virens]